MMMGNRDWVFQQEARKPQRRRRDARPLLGATSASTRLVLVLVAVLVIASTYLQVHHPEPDWPGGRLLPRAGAARRRTRYLAARNCWFATLPPERDDRRLPARASAAAGGADRRRCSSSARC